MSETPPPSPLSTWGEAFETHLHCRGTAVCLNGAAVLILGASGRGKSELALQLMAHDAKLIADDGIWVTRRAGQLWAAAPPSAPPMIEARHIGLLEAELLPGRHPLSLAVDLDHAEPARLPPRCLAAWRGVEVPLIHGAGNSTLWASLLQYLKGGRAR